MIRCDSCGAGTMFLSPQNDCFACAQHDPLERAAIARYKHSAPGAISWEEATEEIRKRVRRYAREILTAAINVDELAEHIGPDHARIVHTHLLGSAAP